MVRLNKIYTRTGDDGTTGLGNGERRAKFDPRVAAYGEVDETNSAIGLARLATLAPPTPISRGSTRCCAQSRTICSISAPISACPSPRRSKAARPVARAAAHRRLSQVARLEAAIDASTPIFRRCARSCCPAARPPPRRCIWRAPICRRAERQIVALAALEGESVGAPAIAYINRLSDFLFVAARFANDRGKGRHIMGSRRESERETGVKAT